MSTKRKGLLQKVLMLVLVLCLVCGNGLMALADEAVASSMRLTKTEGTVSVTNKNGRDMGTMADMKLFNGYHLSTAQKSYAWMNLDDHKLVKMDAVSEAEIQKKGKDLEILLNSGNLLFNVSEHLKADETLNVRTSTMVTGIRGTCGWVKVIDSSRTQVYILEGQVECYVMDPVTGQYKNVVLRSGEMAEFVVYDQTRVGDKCDILINRFDEKKIDGFVAVELLNDSSLRDRITGVLNLDMNWISANGPAILSQDQQHVEQKFVSINESVKQQENKVTKDPLFKTGSDDDDDDGGGSSTGQPSNPTPDTEEEDTLKVEDPVNLYMDTEDPAFLATAENLEKYLSLEHITKVNVINAANVESMFMLDRSVIVESGEIVNFDPNINVTVNNDEIFTINGTVELLGGNLINNGTISNTSTNSLRITGELQNAESGSIDNIGLIRATQGVINHGSVFNAKVIEGNVEAVDGIFENQDGGTISGSVTATDDGYVVLNKSIPSGGISINGGSIELVGIENTNDIPTTITNGTLIVAEGTTIPDVSLSATNSGNGTLTVKNGGTVTNVEADGGEICVEGGSIGTIGDDNPINAVVYMNRGTVGTINYDAGVLELTGGTIEYVSGTESTSLIVSGGNIGSENDEMLGGINLNGAAFSNGDETISITGAQGTMVVEDGTVKLASLSGVENSDGDVLTVIGGDGIESLEQYSGQLDISGGKVTDILTIDTAVTMTGGEVESLDISYYEGQDVIISGGEIGTMTVNGGEVILGEENTTAENIKTTEVTVNNGRITVNGGTHGSVTLNSSNGMMNGGSITNGLSLNGENESDPVIFNVYGGTISAGESNAAIYVDTVLNPEETLISYGYKLGNVVIFGGTIDGQTNSAIEVVRGDVAVDLLDNSTEEVQDTMIPVIKGQNPSEFFNVSEDEESILRIWFDGPSENGIVGPMQKHYTKDAYLFFDQVEGGYSLKRLEETFIDALMNLTGGECLILPEDFDPAEASGIDTDLYLSPDMTDSGRPAILDLNGHSLNLNSNFYLAYQEDSDAADLSDQFGLKICNSSSTESSLSIMNVQNYGLLVFESINLTIANSEAIRNYGKLSFIGSECNLDYDIMNYCSLNIKDSDMIMSAIYNMVEMIDDPTGATEDLVAQRAKMNIENSVIYFDIGYYGIGISNGGTLTISDSELYGEDIMLIQNAEGTAHISGSSELYVTREDPDSTYYTYAVFVSGGEVDIDGDDGIVNVYSNNVAFGMDYDDYFEGGNNNVPPTLRLSNTTVEGGNSTEIGYTIRADENSTIIVDEGTTIKANGNFGAIYCEAYLTDTDGSGEAVGSEAEIMYQIPTLKLNGGSIISDAAEGYVIRWDVSGDFIKYEIDENSWNVLQKGINTEIKGANEESIEKGLLVEVYNINFLLEDPSTGIPDEDHISGTRYPIPSGYVVGLGEDNYYTFQKDSRRTNSLFSFFRPIRDTAETETSSNATVSNATATDSNAFGTPTSSKSAIPMAVAMLAGLMAIAPKLFEDSEYKNRKER